MKIGVLALQGDFAAHQRVLQAAGLDAPEVRTPAALHDLDGLVIPGGESTTMLRLMNIYGLVEPLRSFVANGGGVFGTCAGVILMANRVTNPEQPSLGFMDVDVRRNAYGRQLDSFITHLGAKPLGEQPLEAVFIRAPVVDRVGADVEVLAEQDGKPVLLRQGRHLACTFHPELTADRRVHEYFARMLSDRPASAARDPSAAAGEGGDLASRMGAGSAG
jgi:5'-phosphate synthase pdxT subunit